MDAIRQEIKTNGAVPIDAVDIGRIRYRITDRSINGLCFDGEYVWIQFPDRVEQIHGAICRILHKEA